MCPLKNPQYMIIFLIRHLFKILQTYCTDLMCCQIRCRARAWVCSADRRREMSLYSGPFQGPSQSRRCLCQNQWPCYRTSLLCCRPYLGGNVKTLAQSIITARTNQVTHPASWMLKIIIKIRVINPD